MRFLVRAFVLAVPVALTATAAQAPAAAPAHRGAAPPAARRVAPPRRVANANTANPYGLPQAALVGHPELQGHAAGFTGIRPGAYSNSGRYYYGNGTGNNGHDRDHRRPGVVPYAYYSAPFLPFFDYGDYYGSGSPQDAAAADAGSAQAQDAAVTANMLGDQVDRLSAEVESLRNQQTMQASQPAQPAAPPTPNTPYAAPAPQVQEQAPAEPPITVVLKNGRKFQAQNYAVMGQTFWDFSSQPAHRIPMAAINVPASVTASSANGAEFPNVQASN